jgi:hypothetical protein
MGWIGEGEEIRNSQGLSSVFQRERERERKLRFGFEKRKGKCIEIGN